VSGGDPGERYARQLVIPEVGDAGQAKLARSRVLVIGAGGLGSPVLYYLAGAGVGQIDVVDPDAVAVSNLHRQILFTTPDVGRPKVEVAAERLRALNPEVTVVAHPVRVDERNVDTLIADHDIVVDCPDNLATRYVVNDACCRAGIPLVEAAVLAFSGMVMTIVPGKTPCYRCLYPVPPKEGSVPTGAEAGIMGMLPGLFGSLQALEVVKLLVGAGSPPGGRVLFFDGLAGSFDEVAADRNPDCPACGALRAGSLR
jgi:molybdopterin/thiamine biosynthesis adenylyltransferase